jgi:hypothetical protein
MSEFDQWVQTANSIQDGAQSALERMLLEAFLQGKGYHLADLEQLPPEKAQALMVEASQFASLRLAQVESTAHFREEIRRID